MLVAILLIIIGLLLLIGGGELLVRGSAGLAYALGISPLVIGLTVVAFGTSSPELAVNASAAFSRQTELSFGNIIGSNLANLGLILGIAALVKPLSVQNMVVQREIPMMLLVTVAALVMGLDPVLMGTVAQMDREDGWLYLILFCVFMYYTISDAIRQRRLGVSAGEGDVEAPKSVLVNVLLSIAGLVLLVAGGRLTVTYATDLAVAAGISQAIIGLTIVAVGTSLPELVTSVVAAARGQSDLALGNVVGSNIFNLLFIQGITAAIYPIPFPRGGYFDIGFLLFISLLILPLALTHRFRLVRWEGALLIGLYVVYLVMRTSIYGLQ